MSKRKSAHRSRVEQLMQKVREISGIAPLPSKPTVPDAKMIIAQAKLILEEALEVFEACGLYLTHNGERVGPGELALHCTPDATIDLPHVAKELSDLSVVNTGMFVEFGISDVPVLEEVDANNLAKFGPGGYLDENRKWRKPPNHPKPDIGKLLKAQGWVESEVSDRETESTLPATENVPVSN